jgi:hypothetical protein
MEQQQFQFPRVKKDEVDVSPIQMAVYVPSSNFDKKISDAEFQKRIKETYSFLNRAFGGTTRVRGIGSWYNDGNKLVNEKVAIVETFAKIKDYKQAQNKLKAWLKQKRKEWKQWALSFEFENDLYFIKG